MSGSSDWNFMDFYPLPCNGFSNIFTHFHSSSTVYLEAVHPWFEETKKKLWVPCYLQSTKPENPVNVCWTCWDISSQKWERHLLGHFIHTICVSFTRYYVFMMVIKVLFIMFVTTNLFNSTSHAPVY